MKKYLALLLFLGVMPLYAAEEAAFQEHLVEHASVEHEQNADQQKINALQEHEKQVAYARLQDVHRQNLEVKDQEVVKPGIFSARAKKDAYEAYQDQVKAVQDGMKDSTFVPEKQSLLARVKAAGKSMMDSVESMLHSLIGSPKKVELVKEKLVSVENDVEKMNKQYQTFVGRARGSMQNIEVKLYFNKMLSDLDALKSKTLSPLQDDGRIASLKATFKDMQDAFEMYKNKGVLSEKEYQTLISKLDEAFPGEFISKKSEDQQSSAAPKRARSATNDELPPVDAKDDAFVKTGKVEIKGPEHYQEKFTQFLRESNLQDMDIASLNAKYDELLEQFLKEFESAPQDARTEDSYKETLSEMNQMYAERKAAIDKVEAVRGVSSGEKSAANESRKSTQTSVTASTVEQEPVMSKAVQLKMKEVNELFNKSTPNSIEQDLSSLLQSVEQDKSLTENDRIELMEKVFDAYQARYDGLFAALRRV